MQRIKICKLSPNAVIPTYGSEHAAGFDLYATEDVIITPGETALVPTGLAFEIPVGYEMQIRPRSGVTWKTKLRVQLGTVDADYRGEVSVIVDNISQESALRPTEIRYVHNDHLTDVGGKTTRTPKRYPHGTYKIYAGDRIAQGVIAPVTRVSFTETDEELTQTERGSGGFGSTGITAEVGE